MVYRRLRLRLELPVEVLRHTLERIREGDARARCAVSAGPVELRQIARDLNLLLDRAAASNAAGPPEQVRRDAAELRRLLLWALDQRPVPTLVLDAAGQTVAMNTAMQNIDPAPVDDAGNVAEGWVALNLEGTNLRVVHPSA